MTDCVGNKLKVGDSVVYIKKISCISYLARGEVTSIKKMFGKDIAIVNGCNIVTCNGVTSQSIYKLKK